MASNGSRTDAPPPYSTDSAPPEYAEESYPASFPPPHFRLNPWDYDLEAAHGIMAVQGLSDRPFVVAIANMENYGSEAERRLREMQTRYYHQREQPGRNSSPVTAAVQQSEGVVEARKKRAKWIAWGTCCFSVLAVCALVAIIVRTAVENHNNVDQE
jgi:hypothetical protein